MPFGNFRNGPGLYHKGFEKDVIKANKMPFDVNPLFADRKVLAESSVFGENVRKDYWGAVKSLFHKLKIGGTYGMRFDTMSDRPDGCFNASEHLGSKFGCCLEQTFLFLSIATNAGLNARQTNVMGFLIIKREGGRYGYHACPGIIIQPSLKGDYAWIDHYKFRTNHQFRENTLKKANLPQDSDVSLVLIDLTDSKIGAQHKYLFPMDNNSVISAYLNNSGASFYSGGNKAKALERWHYAVEIGKDKVAYSNIIKHFWEMHDIKKVKDMSEDFCNLINPKDMLKHSEATKKLGEGWDLSGPYIALSEDPNCVDAYLYLASAYALAKDKDAALLLLSSLREKLKSIMEDRYLHISTIKEKEDKMDLEQNAMKLRMDLSRCEQLIRIIVNNDDLSEDYLLI